MTISTLSNSDACFLRELGQEAGCRQLAREFYARVARDGELKPLFPGKCLRCATEEFAAFFIQLLDGDPDKAQYRWWLSLRESHARFEISERQRAAWLGLMQETIHTVVNDAATQAALEQFFRSTSAYVIGSGASGEVENEELCRAWQRQLMLDCLVEHIAIGRDADAIALAHRFTSRKSVFVGILARMMEAGREPLVDYVLESIQDGNELATARFNGRTLLHFAAGYSCLPVVRHLLAVGVEPNVLDRGGHTPLYRVAGPRSETGAAIVEVLAQAGAMVDHCGGVNKSTALHQAARFGDLQVAVALLDAGASPTVLDRNGLTPLDRARNCRRSVVAALLSAR